MKILNPNVEISFRETESTDSISVYKKLEKIARLCYKSEEKITDISYYAMLNNLKTRGHFAMLEHHNFVMKVSNEFLHNILEEYKFANSDQDEFRRAFKFLTITNGKQNGPSYISGSTTTFNNLWKTLTNQIYCEFLCRFMKRKYPLIMDIPMDATPNWIETYSEHVILSNEEIEALPYHIRRNHDYITALFHTDRGVSHEIVRHRCGSYAQESTRYCNYGKENDISFILPSWIDGDDCHGNYHINWNGCIGDHDADPFENGSPESWWFWGCANAERQYQELIKNGWMSQQARSVLNNSLKTEIYVTYNLAEWEWFMKMRIPKTAHPDMRAISIPLQNKIIEMVPEFPYTPVN